MPTLPTVGGSSNTWGTELNKYLDPVLDKFGAPDTAFEFTTSSFTGLTSLSGTPDTMDANTTVPGALYINDNASSAALCGKYATAPSAPFSAITRVIDTNIRIDFNQAGLFIGEATPGVLETILYVSVTTPFIRQDRYTNPTTFASSQAGTSTTIGQAPLYFAIKVNSSSSVDFMYSWNANVWSILIAARNPAITIGSVGLFMASVNVAGLSVTFDYLRIWNSALTFPGA